MPDLIAGTVVRAADRMKLMESWDNSVASVTNTSYQTGTPVVGGTFTPPTSGRVEVTATVAARSTDGLWRLVYAYEIYQGTDASSGAPVVVASVQPTGVVSVQTARNYHLWSRITTADGLKPYTTHFIRTLVRCTGGTSVGYFHRAVMVWGVP